ncbi:hypothetical protein OJ723_002752 [Salmonella enterica]|nr:hypothetical protein [Salmonella enterica subsp. enterica serovar Orientalis]EBJ4008967.1 hypothetical protein [Salmonella enterica]EBQ9235298.1 hypothetical protein [Salmonella enterica subsp. enterica serovar Orientalis]EKA1666922.1 hypothetical protein [Salmonella enterica]
MTDTQTLFTHYRQVKNPNPAFTPREGKKTLPFCRKLMAKAEGFTSRFDFTIYVAIACSQGKRRCMPPVLRCRAIDALLQGMCFHYDPVTNSVQCSVTDLAIECGLATRSAKGILSINKATRTLRFLDETLGLIAYVSRNSRGGGAPGITFTPALFKAMNVFPLALSEARLECLKARAVAEEYSDE